MLNVAHEDHSLCARRYRVYGRPATAELPIAPCIFAAKDGEMFNWDDLRIFLAAARAESTAGAALRLGLDATTVSRRVRALETTLKAALFIRSSRGLQLTATGARLLETATNAESAMTLAEQVGQSDLIAGTIRISASEGFGTVVLAPALPGLRALYPALVIELIANAGFLSPLKREVDIAVTLSAPTSPRLVVEPLTDYELGLYAAPSYVNARGPIDSVDALRSLDLVGYVEDQIYAPELRYLDEIDPVLRARLSSSSLHGQREILLNGGGVGVLPCFLADGLTRLLPRSVRLTRRFWMSTHREVAGSARIRGVRTWMRALVARERERLVPSR
jgi:DNA-binding transcriptional LysR family regulator